MQRVDLFTSIHKAIRTMIYELGIQMQCADFTDRNTIESVAREVRQFIGFLDEHAEHEDKRIFPAVQGFETDMTNRMSREHRDLELKQADLANTLARLEAAKTQTDRLEAGRAMLINFDDVAALCLTHMRDEEQSVLPATWLHMSDEELLDLRAMVQESIPPARYAEWLHWMFISMNPAELSGMLGGLRASAPDVYTRTVPIAENALDSERWEEVRSRIED